LVLGWYGPGLVVELDWDDMEPDQELGFEAKVIETQFTRGEVLAIMRMIPDSIVMIQTLQKSDEYTGERDWDRR